MKQELGQFNGAEFKVFIVFVLTAITWMLRTVLDESKLASLKIPHEVVKAGLSKVLSCYHYELISLLHLLHSYGVSSYFHQSCPL